ncbi:DUF2066 domain-containing protein [Marinicella sp. S1101]|uniref:DUF2066 domain-containing protein n=1 Tax=Marinicella marina TaxID=2996016 RepID=UPI002260E961|nr:DUF2066 domain-containing protein [Marinicella marina]MCX7554996.1 DUF2066 domain-containing protein [Marinicella marina]MDJ1141340.1 DUF2066 domain-containing protein [Marinicella marina]
MKIFVILLFLVSSNIDAANIVTNQSASLVVPSEQTLWEQQRQGLIAVLSMKSGLSQRTIQAEYDVNENFRTAILRTYMERLPENMNGDKQWLNLTVDEMKLQQLMLEQRIPIWPNRRGEVFVWVVNESNDQSLQHAKNDAPAVYWLSRWFKYLGIPTQFYDASADDLLNFKPEDVRFLNPDLIDFIQANNEISKVLLVFIKDTGNGYSYRYGLTETGEQVVIKNRQFIDLSAGMLSLANDIQAAMADDQRLFPDEFKPSTVSLIINDINSANKMLDLISYLDEHPLIDNYLINQSIGEQVQLMAEIKVLPDTFVAFVEKEGALIHQPLTIGSSILFKIAE